MQFSQYLFYKDLPFKTTIRNYTNNDFDQLIAIQKECFPPPFPSDLWWTKDQLASHLRHFPKGAICAEVDGILAGSITTLIVDYNGEDHTWNEITDNGSIGTHQTFGNVLYVVDISVRPKFRGTGVGRLLMQSLFHLVVELKLEAVLGGSRMPGYEKVKDHMTPEKYLAEIITGSYKDPVVSFLMKTGRTPVKLLPNYLDDPESANYGVLMEWKNPFLEKSQ
ncbi:GNAT family N-acetyltransferase [Pseudalkalibacillus berkeleyi]|uniref:GNAT family N-acetyltransferase n=1 Tax=Pseudalkalibacillus berkeleyi TaxID=1069813 RepID=A0ABS9H301_9BACL|nr:GNAT family N-acetyltransferase [Pseudalkalibacillus berkeleyi]MCF6138025.1 GNAT family N-acetyltransferase [Pseudalkalibacillus berkeleyi]